MEYRGTQVRHARRALSVACALLLLVIPAGRARADDAHASAAQRALEAIAAADEDALRDVARAVDLDPWLVADALLAMDEPDAALRFAGVVDSVEAKALRTYVAAHAETDERKARRRLVAAVERARADAPHQLGPLLKHGVGGTPDDVPSIRLHGWRAGWTAEQEGARAYDSVRAAAEALGWLAEAARLSAEAGGLAYEQGDPAEAERLFRAWAALEARRGNTSGEIRALETLGGLLELYGRFEDARESYGRGLAVADASADDHGIATMARALAAVSHTLGDSRDAIVLLRRSLALFEAANDANEEATTLSELGTMWLDLGESEKALDMLRRARSLFEHADDRASAALVLGNIGAVHERRGEPEEARQAYHAVLAVMEAHDDAVGQATSLLNLGVVAEAQDRPDEAVAFYERALVLYESVDLPSGVLAAHTNLGRACAASGDAESARDHREKARDLADRFGDPRSQGAAHEAMAEFELAAENLEAAAEHANDALARYEAAGDLVGTAGALRLVGIAAHRGAETRGDLEGAARKIRRAYELAREAGTRDVAVRCLIALAAVRFDGADYVEATRLARDAALEVPLLVRGQDEERGATGRRGWADAFVLGIEASLARDDPEGALWFVEAGRAGALLESLGGAEALRAHTLSGKLRRREAEARSDVRRALAEYQRAREGGDRKSRKPAKRSLMGAQQALKEVIAEIQVEAKSATDTLYPEPSSLDEIQAALRPSEVLVLYVLGDAKSRAFVVGKDLLRVVALAGRAAIETAVDRLLQPEAPYVEPEAVADLRTLLVAPLELGDDVERVLVSPDGVVARVPFALIEDRQVGYVPSGTTYVLLAEQRAIRGTGVLGLGDPDYAGHELSLVPLPGTRDEVEQVADVRFFGPDASEASLRKTLPRRRRWRAVHIACHGLIDANQPMLSKLALSVDPENDGSLTVAEVMRLDAPADLATLSACDVGRGEIVSGEGVLGFARAFMFAGAPRVIVSLWRVDDQATRALMAALYARWNPRDGSPGQPLARALREAQDEVRNTPRWAHPQYWAAWTLWGLPDADADAVAQISIEEAVRRATTAAATGDVASLSALAARDDPDPWRVVGRLIEEHKPGIALALAEAGTTADTAGLAAWVRSDPAADRSWRRRVDRARRLILAGEDDEALAVLSAASPPGGVTGVRALRQRAEALMASRYGAAGSEAVATFRDAARRANALGWLTQAVGCYERAGQLALHLGDHTGAVVAWSQMLAVQRKRGDAEGEANASVDLGVALQALRGALDQARQQQQHALAIFDGLGDETGATTARSNIVAVLIQQGLLEEARPVARQVLEDANRLGLRRLAANATGNLGMILDGLGQDEARQTYERAIDALSAVRDAVNLALVRGHLGRLLERQGLMDDALVHHRAALHIFEERGNVGGEANALADVGAVHAAIGEHAAAETAFRESLAIWNGIGDPAGLARGWGNLGYVAFARGNARDAIEAHARMRAAMRASGNAEGATDARASLAEAHALAGSYAHADALWTEAIDEATRQKDDARRLEAHLGRARLRWSLGDAEGARVDLARARVLATANVADPGQAGRVDAVEKTFVDSAAPDALRVGLDAEATFAALVQVASFDLLDALGGAERMSARAVPDALREPVLEAEARSAFAARNGGDVADADARLSAALDSLHAERPDVAWVLAPRPVALADVQVRMGDGERWQVVFSLDDNSYVLDVTRDAAKVVQADKADRSSGTLIVSTVGAEAAVDGRGRRVPFLAFVHRGPRSSAPADGVLVVANPGGERDARAQQVYAVPRLDPAKPTWPDDRPRTHVGAATEAGFRTARKARERWRAIVFDAPLALHASRSDLSGIWLTPSDEDDGVLTGLDLAGTDLRCDVLVLPHVEGPEGVDAGRARTALVAAAMMAGADTVLLGRADTEPEVTTRFLRAFRAALMEGLAPEAAMAKAQSRVEDSGFELMSSR